MHTYKIRYTTPSGKCLAHTIARIRTRNFGQKCQVINPVGKYERVEPATAPTYPANTDTPF